MSNSHKQLQILTMTIADETFFDREEAVPRVYISVSLLRTVDSREYPGNAYVD